jgi:glutathione S-transferase
MKLYWGPHTCAIGIHILLEEIGLVYETEKVDVAGGETHKPEFKAINPKSKVPTLVRDDGSVLTEFGAIASWLAHTYPDKQLLPREAEGIARVYEVLGYVEGTVHGQGFARIFLPSRFEPQDFVHQTIGIGKRSVVEQGKEMVRESFAILESQWRGTAYAWGEGLTIADAALFYAERWAPGQDIELPAHLRNHLEVMKARPAVRKVMEIWGES